MTRANGTIRVLVVDDSTLVRDMIQAILSSEPGIEVVGEATDGAKAVDAVLRLSPDIVTMDIEMPVMGGLEAIERIIAARPTPILVVTALTGVRTAFAAVSKGALDVIEKPDISPENALNLIKKIRLLSRVDVSAHLQTFARQRPAAAGGSTPRGGHQPDGRIVAVAASTGGPQAIQNILSRLPASFAAPIVVTQHIAEGFAQGMADWLNSSTPLRVTVARNGELVAPGCVYINPAEHSMRITGQGMIILGGNDAKQVYHPCCNTMLTSVAATYRERAIGLILSGMGDDGVAGMQAIKKGGGITLSQDGATSVVYGMNRIAVERGHVDRLLPLADLPDELVALVGGK